jgi:hypothetical protein
MSDIATINDADKSWHFGFTCQWPDLYRRGLNWRNFALIAVEFEWGKYKGRYVEGRIALLGLVFTFEWEHRCGRAAFMADLEQRKAEALEHLRRMDDPEAPHAQ